MGFYYVTGSASLPFSGSIPVPAEDEQVNSNSIINGFRALADRTTALSSSLTSVSSSFKTRLSVMSGSSTVPLILSSSYTAHHNVFTSYVTFNGQTTQTSHGVDADISTARFTAQEAGFYAINYQGSFSSIPATTTINVGLTKNGTIISAIPVINSTAGSVERSWSLSGITYLEINDFVDIRYFTLLGSTSVVSNHPYASIMRI